MTATSSGVFEANWSFMIEPIGLRSRRSASLQLPSKVGIDNESDQVS
jgi:hypothetical protein